MRRTLLGALFLLACAVAGGRAEACSLGAGALLPTNYELVQSTEAIVLARAAFDGQPAGDRELGQSVRFTVVDVLRGGFPERTLRLDGSPSFRGASPEGDFARARPGAFAGACVAFDYRSGHLYVLFLERSAKGAWGLHHVAFSRVNEEVASPDSPWVSAVRAYARIADLADAGREKQALRELAKTGGPAIAEDVERHFRTATYAKSEADLLTIHRQAKTAGEVSAALWGLTQYGGAETTAIFHGLLAATQLADDSASQAIQWAERQHAERELPNILRHAAARPRGQHWFFLSAIGALGGTGDLPAVEALVPQLTDEELAVLGKEAPWLGASAKTVEDLRRRIGDRPRDTWDLAFTLAAWGDRTILERALTDLGAPGERRWVDPYIVARSTRPEVPEALERILATGDAELVAWFVEGLRESKRDDRLALLTTALEKRSAPAIVEAARKALLVMDRQGVAGAKALAAALPPAPVDDDEETDDGEN